MLLIKILKSLKDLIKCSVLFHLPQKGWGVFGLMRLVSSDALINREKGLPTAHCTCGLVSWLLCAWPVCSDIQHECGPSNDLESEKPTAPVQLGPFCHFSEKLLIISSGKPEALFQGPGMVGSISLFLKPIIWSDGELPLTGSLGSNSLIQSQLFWTWKQFFYQK
jgi:hypothetical protein